jgi:hypothetical protein
MEEQEFVFDTWPCPQCGAAMPGEMTRLPDGRLVGNVYYLCPVHDAEWRPRPSPSGGNMFCMALPAGSRHHGPPHIYSAKELRAAEAVKAASVGKAA